MATTTTPPDEVLTITEAASLLRCSRSFLHKATHDGKVPHRRLGHEYRFLRSELLRWLDTQPGAVPLADVQLHGLVERTADRHQDNG